MTGIDAEAPARSAFRRGLLACGVSVGGLVARHHAEVAAEMFAAATRADPSVCDDSLGRLWLGEDSAEVLAGAWAAVGTLGWDIRRLGAPRCQKNNPTES